MIVYFGHSGLCRAADGSCFQRVPVASVAAHSGAFAESGTILIPATLGMQSWIITTPWFDSGQLERETDAAPSSRSDRIPQTKGKR